MYEAYYGLSERPFSLLPDPDFLYLSKSHEAALTLLEYGFMSQAGFTVITGEIGSGKTTLSRHILNKLGDEITVGLITNAQKSFGELLQWVLLAFGLDYKNKTKVELYQAFNDFLIDEYSKNHRTVLMIDEAQNLSIETMEELRMLSNINTDKHQVLQMVLLGQPELRTMLRRPELEQFSQRISVDFHLKRLDKEESKAYIKHRLTVVGGNPDLFDDEACEAAFMLSHGTPRIINRVCDLALVYGFANEQPQITAEIMLEVTMDRAEVESTASHRLGLSDNTATTDDGVIDSPHAVVSETVSNVHKELQSYLGHAIDAFRKLKLPKF